MYNTDKLIETGQAAVRRNPHRDLTSYELRQMHDRAEDQYQFATNCYLAGVAIGMRIAKAEQGARKSL